MSRHTLADVGEVCLASARHVNHPTTVDDHDSIRKFKPFVEVLADEKSGGAQPPSCATR
jgi:hypothetical protein